MLLCVQMNKMLQFRKKLSYKKRKEIKGLKYSIGEIFEAPLQLLLNIPPYTNVFLPYSVLKRVFCGLSFLVNE